MHSTRSRASKGKHIKVNLLFIRSKWSTNVSASTFYRLLCCFISQSSIEPYPFLISGLSVGSVLHHTVLNQHTVGFGHQCSNQIFNFRILVEKHLQHQWNLYHSFIDFKKAFERVWHWGLWHAMRKFNIEEGFVQAIEALFNGSTSTVMLNHQIGAYFPNAVGVRQGCALSSVPLCLEHHARSSSRHSYFHLNWWTADMQPSLCRRHKSLSRH